MNAIEVKNLCKIYNQNKPNEFHALKNINLTVKSGDLVILKGVSGSGKSTLLGILGALSKPSSGEALINGRNVSKLPDIMSSNFRHSEVGFIFQSFNLISYKTALENVALPLYYHDLANPDAKMLYWIDGQPVTPISGAITFGSKGEHTLRIEIEETPTRKWEIEYKLNVD